MRRKRLLLLSITLLAVLGIAACGKKSEQADEGYIEEPSSTYETLSESSESRFSYDDLITDNIKAGMLPDEVIAILGKPVSDSVNNSLENQERVLLYENNGKKTTFLFWMNNGELKLCGVDSNDPERVFSRNTKVGMKYEQVRDAYYRDANCQNSNVMSDDNATILGKFLYGDNTIDRLDTKKITTDLQYGIINYNGGKSMETGERMLEYMLMPAPFISDFAGYNDDYAQLLYYMDNSGVISRICWYYYPEIRN